jgi:hypothetical protein
MSLAGGLPIVRKAGPMLDLQVGLHVFMTVLIFGTLWRVIQYHLMASSNTGLQHVGKAMSTQY